MWRVAMSKCTYMILERSLMLEIRPANAEPQLPAVLLMRAPIPPHGKWLSTLAAAEGLRTMLTFVVRLKCPKILQWLRSWMLYVVLAPLSTAVTWQPEN